MGLLVPHCMLMVIRRRSPGCRWARFSAPGSPGRVLAGAVSLLGQALRDGIVATARDVGDLGALCAGHCPSHDAGSFGAILASSPIDRSGGARRDLRVIVGVFIYR